jgi:hypothetical protein
MIALYEFMRDEEGARSSFGTASVTMWLGERADPATSNPISVSFYTDGFLAINFGFLLGHRSRAELTRLADIIRRIPGARRSVEGIEDRDFRTRRGMRPEEVLASEQGLEAFKKAIAEAVRPPAPSSGSVPPPE